MAINNLPDSPRQKMINLMYIVLMAMLALNTPSDVPEGLSLADDGATSGAITNYTDSVINDGLRTKQLQAFVIPGSEYVMRGNKITARVLLAAIDSTNPPDVFINGQQLPAGNMGYYETVANRTGDFLLEGYLRFDDADGPLQFDFSQKYTIVEPSATVSATMMNVLYAGYDNPLSISVPGVPGGRVNASLANNNGTLRRTNSGYTINPARVGDEAVIRVSATVDGQVRTMGNYTFQVRKLPDPSPFIDYTDSKGEARRYSGGTGLNKTSLQNAVGITAAIDDGLLNIAFRVLDFETIFFDNMGNAVPEISAGSAFSSRQKDMFRRLTRGQRFYISRVRAVGPDGIERVLRNTLEVIII